jgi:DNA-binding IclR family transcriptional regulator
MEGSILELLEQHGSLAYEQIAAHLSVPPDQVRNELAGMHERGWVDVLKVDRDGPAYWFTDRRWLRGARVETTRNLGSEPWAREVRSVWP